MKLITKLRKADASKKTDVWYEANLTQHEAVALVREMVLSLPAGSYKLHSREYGVSLIDAIYETYGNHPSMLIDEALMLGLAVLSPEKVYASFTHGLDLVTIEA